MESIMETIESLLAALTSKKLRLYESLTEAVGQESGAHIDRHLDDGYISNWAGDLQNVECTRPVRLSPAQVAALASWVKWTQDENNDVPKLSAGISARLYQLGNGSYILAPEGWN